jgi:Na+/H+ antiporter NhaD/arsenite permease-like protein
MPFYLSKAAFIVFFFFPQHASPAVQRGFIAATIFGCDLGPNLTTVGSLATVPRSRLNLT